VKGLEPNGGKHRPSTAGKRVEIGGAKDRGGLKGVKALLALALRLLASVAIAVCLSPTLLGTCRSVQTHLDREIGVFHIFATRAVGVASNVTKFDNVPTAAVLGFQDPCLVQEMIARPISRAMDTAAFQTTLNCLCFKT